MDYEWILCDVLCSVNNTGITHDYSEKDKVHIKMDSFVEKLLKDSPEGMKEEAKILAANFLSDINPDAEKIEEKRA